MNNYDEMNLTNRYKLIVLLGERCRMCPENRPDQLEVDHIYNDGDEERAKYGSAEVYRYYLEHPELAFKRLQSLCKNCHEAKTWRFNTSVDDVPFQQLTISEKDSSVSKIQLFVETMRSLEGEDKRPVQKSNLIKYLIETGRFTDEEAKKYTDKLLRECAIYHSKPECVNLV